MLRTRTERAVVWIAITKARCTRRGLLGLVERLKEELQGVIDVEDFSHIVRLVDQEKVKQPTRRRQDE